jgi:hypothetical protein
MGVRGSKFNEVGLTRPVGTHLKSRTNSGLFARKRKTA